MGGSCLVLRESWMQKDAALHLPCAGRKSVGGKEGVSEKTECGGGGTGEGTETLTFDWASEMGGL